MNMNAAIFLTDSEQDQLTYELEQIEDLTEKYPTLSRLYLELESHRTAHRARYVE